MPQHLMNKPREEMLTDLLCWASVQLIKSAARPGEPANQSVVDVLTAISESLAPNFHEIEARGRDARLEFQQNECRSVQNQGEI